MASQVHVGGNGTATGRGHPGRAAVQKFFGRVDSYGAAWFPGRRDVDENPRNSALTPKKAAVICSSMMAAKKRGELPSYDTAVAYCPSATWNEKTEKPFSRHTINDLLTSKCYDDVATRPWQFRFGPKRRALTAEAQAERR